ncbi:MAG: hypothetical protein HKN33_17810 [Pyrinomonadaceae bacterium]|nr:hypothetical protein [Pyrinomonadaceae bacterium]
MVQATTILAGFVYFLLVFAAGFVLGVIRILVLVPRLGAGTAELIELPFMVLISFLAAHLICHRFLIKTASEALTMGTLALILLIGFELTVVLGLRGLSFSDYIKSREPIAFAAYVVSLFLFALMPLFVCSRNEQRIDG